MLRRSVIIERRDRRIGHGSESRATIGALCSAIHAEKHSKPEAKPMLNVKVRIAAVMLLVSSAWSAGGTVWAQSASTNSSIVPHRTSVGNSAVESNLPAGQGGGGGADFTELMTLIQQTIDPDAWIDASSVMTPFPSGVYIDPAGQLQHVSSKTQSFPVSLTARAGQLRHPWRIDSPLRIVSLRQLDETLGQRAASGLQSSQELEHLAGLSRVEYVYVDVPGEDVLLAGPAAGDRAGALQGFRLVDLGLLIELMNARSSPLGCSIDPTDEGILAAQQLVTPAGALKRLAIDPEKFVGQMQDKIGPHHVRVFGMPASSPAAMALVAADEHMKQLGFGTAHTQVPIDSYFDHLDKQADVPKQSLIRWWFTFANEPIQANAQQNLFQLPKQCVALLSEQQWVSLLGRKATGEQDAAADAFAAGMTAGLDELRNAHPAYARMVALFESALALQLAMEASEQYNLHAWFPNLKQLGSVSFDPQFAPKTVSGLTTWHKHTAGTVVAVVSGGVQINPRKLASPARWQSDTVAVDLPLQSHGVDVSRSPWWWD